MRFRFADERLGWVYASGIRVRKYGPDLTDAFLRAMARIESAVNENDLYSLKGLRYEKLRGDRAGQRSIRLNKQWRLILRPDKDAAGDFIWIIDIVDYH